nr:tetratricopeptide repeat protein [Thioalkalivibrio sp. ALJT]
MAPVQGLAVLGLALVLVACATPAPRDATAPAPEPRSMPEPRSSGPDADERDAAPAPEPEVARTPAAALNLAQQAESARQTGNTGRAEQQLERALRIAPRDAGLWHQMAVLRLDQQRFQQAERLAARSLQMAGAGDRDLALRNWRVMLEAREAQGDARGAEEAREAIRRLEAEIV